MTSPVTRRICLGSAFLTLALGVAAAGAGQDGRDHRAGRPTAGRNRLQPVVGRRPAAGASGNVAERGGTSPHDPGGTGTGPSGPGRGRFMPSGSGNPSRWTAGWTRRPGNAPRPIGDFYEQETDEGLPSTERTIVRVVYDDGESLLRVLLHGRREHGRGARDLRTRERSAHEDSRPRTMFRDENIGSDDAVAVMLDAYNDQRSAIFLATNANGILFDMSQNGQGPETRNMNWDAVWESRGQVDPRRLDSRNPDPVQVPPLPAPPAGPGGGVRSRLQAEHPRKDRGGSTGPSSPTTPPGTGRPNSASSGESKESSPAATWRSGLTRSAR